MNQKRHELFREIRMGFPTPRIMEVVSVGAIKFGDKLIILKCRYEEEDLPRMLEKQPFIKYNDTLEYIKHARHDFKEILAKNVIFDNSILRRRGLIALAELIEMGLDDFMDDSCGFGIKTLENGGL
jgi:hypothetical protein